VRNPQRKATAFHYGSEQPLRRTGYGIYALERPQFSRLAGIAALLLSNSFKLVAAKSMRPMEAFHNRKPSTCNAPGPPKTFFHFEYLDTGLAQRSDSFEQAQARRRM
jgi:hypothetical protein